MGNIVVEREKSVFGLDRVIELDFPHVCLVYQVESIKKAIEALPEEQRDNWVLPNIHSSWAYKNGVVEYSFTDDAGQNVSEDYFCGVHAEAEIRNGTNTQPYLNNRVYSSEDSVYCVVCGRELTN